MLKVRIDPEAMTFSANYLQRPLLGGRLNFPVTLAPMVGLSHVALRQLVRRYCPRDAVTVWPTEMLSSWRLPREVLGATPETLKADGETDLVPQILGNEEEPIRESVARLEAWGAVGVDINMGCPVKKALRHNYGVALMGDAAYAAKVVRVTARHARIPVSVKLRAGLQNDAEYLIRFVRGLEDAGAAWITLHPRVGHMKRRGAADWTQIAHTRLALRIPVIGNGDVQCADDVFAMLDVGQCDSVMIGRALCARPWLLWQVGERLGFALPATFGDGARPPITPLEEGAEYGRALAFLLQELGARFSEEDALKRLRFHVRMTAGWLEWGQNLFALVNKAKTLVEIRERAAAFFELPQKMYLRTQNRE